MLSTQNSRPLCFHVVGGNSFCSQPGGLDEGLHGIVPAVLSGSFMSSGNRLMSAWMLTLAIPALASRVGDDASRRALKLGQLHPAKC